MRVLVTGGAGYIGSFMTKRLLDDGITVVVIDSLERGHKEAVDNRATFIQGNLLDKSFLDTIFREHQFAAVLHFAAFISMGESMENPGLYFENNIYGALNLLENMQRQGIRQFIFSSTAGVYGNPQKIPIPEDHPKNPTNPYGQSKLMVEQILQWYFTIYHINSVSLRYFNAAGATLDGTLGENHPVESHIIPNIMHSLLENRPFHLFGMDYQTKDGTCIRDYIHVLDLIEAHMLSLKKLEHEDGAFHYNVGTGKGYSNKEVIDMVKKITSSDIIIQAAEKRPGDAGVLIANSDKIKRELGFAPKYSDLETIVVTAWEWHRKKLKIKK